MATPAWIVPMSGTLSIAAFDRAPNRTALRKSVPVDGTLHGVPLPRPLVSTALPLRSGQTRHVVLLRHSAARIASEHLTLSIGENTVASIDPSWLQSPIREPIDLVSGLTAEGAARLVRLILSTIPPLLGKSPGKDYRQTARAVVDLLHLPEGQLVSCCALGSAGDVLSYRLPAPLPSLPASLVGWYDDRIDTLAPSCLSLDDNQTLHVFLKDRSRMPPDFVTLGEHPLLLQSSQGMPDREPFLPWLERCGKDTRRWGEELLHRHAARDKAAAAMVRERRLGPQQPPSAKIHLVAATRAGVLLWLDVGDPHRLVSALRVEADGEHVDVAVPMSGQIRAHLTFPQSAKLRLSYRLRYIYGSGRIATFDEGYLDPFSGLFPADVPIDAPTEAGHALMTAWDARIVAASQPHVEDHGPCRPNPRLSLIVAKATVPDMVRARASHVACEAARGQIEIIYTIAGAASFALRRLLRETAEVYGVAHRLVCLPAETTAPDLLIAGLDCARAPAALVTCADVLPAAPGWAEHWIASLTQAGGPGLIGATLLSTDGAVEHAGGHFTWTGRSAPAVPCLRSAGLPAEDLPSDADLLPTEALSADAVGLTSAAMKAVLSDGACSPDTATILQIAAHRLGAATFRDGRFVRFAAAPEAPEVIAASGCWKMSAILAATDGLAAH